MYQHLHQHDELWSQYNNPVWTDLNMNIPRGSLGGKNNLKIYKDYIYLLGISVSPSFSAFLLACKCFHMTIIFDKIKINVSHI